MDYIGTIFSVIKTAYDKYQQYGENEKECGALLDRVSALRPTLNRPSTLSRFFVLI